MPQRKTQMVFVMMSSATAIRGFGLFSMVGSFLILRLQPSLSRYTEDWLMDHLCLQFSNPILQSGFAFLGETDAVNLFNSLDA